ncbi:collagen-like protein [Cytobacillus sp. FSL K6-0265]|uniref:collagen-like protein n=1 Tax=Cytobacillus sp. FSL K6-0265 TaxID=2921448 RepID=UPI0030F6D972
MPTKDELKQVFVTGAVPTQQDFHDLIDLAGTPGPKGDTGAIGPAGPKGDTGATGANGVSIVSATSDGTNIVFTLSDDNTLTIPWPTQGG